MTIVSADTTLPYPGDKRRPLPFSNIKILLLISKLLCHSPED